MYIPPHPECVAALYLWKSTVQICDKLRTRSTFSRSVMVSVGISKLSFTDLIFANPGTKINGGYYRDMLLSQQLLPVVRHVSSYISWSFNKTAHLHTGHASDATPCDFLSSQHPLSLLQICGRRIAPISYKICVDIQQQVRQLQSHSIDELKKCLLDVWHSKTRTSLTMQIAIDGWRKSLRACIRAKGGHFEQLL